MGSPIHPTPADRSATRTLASAVLEAIRDDEAMPLPIGAANAGRVNQWLVYDKRDAESLIAQLCGEIVAQHNEIERLRAREAHPCIDNPCDLCRRTEESLGIRSDRTHWDDHEKVSVRLAATQAALDEACDIAKALAWKLHRECPNDTDESEHPSTLKRIPQLRTAGRVK